MLICTDVSEEFDASICMVEDHRRRKLFHGATLTYVKVSNSTFVAEYSDFRASERCP
jgi:hypothetical protein